MTSRSRRLALPLAALALLLLGSACSAADDASSDADSGSSAGLAAPDQAEAARAGDASAPEDRAATDASQRAVVSTGNVSLRAPDVDQLLTDVQAVVDQVRGDVAERTSRSDDDGAVTRSRLVLRVPAESFGDVMGALEKTGTLVSSDSSSADVTTQVIDNRARIAVQRASIDRVRDLLAQATDIGVVVSIEAELSTRQAELDSLEQTQAYLADQTSQSTITVSLARSDTPVAPEQDDASGFLAGLSAGWKALAVAGTGLATIAGALLPWLVVLAAVGVPTALVARRWRRRTTNAAVPSAASTPSDLAGG